MQTDEGLQVVAGDWTSGSNDYVESISVTSGLVPKVSAAAFLCAAQTSSRTQDYFFRFDEDEEEEDDPNDDVNRPVFRGGYLV